MHIRFLMAAVPALSGCITPEVARCGNDNHFSDAALAVELSTRFGGAVEHDGIVLLTDSAPSQRGSAFSPVPFPEASADIRLEFRIRDPGPVKGDGMTLTLLDVSRIEQWDPSLPWLGCDGGDLAVHRGTDCTEGYSLPGMSVEIDTFTNDSADAGIWTEHVAIMLNGEVTSPLAVAPLEAPLDEDWHSLQLLHSDALLSVSLDGELLLEADTFGLADYPFYVGATASTGEGTAAHEVRDVSVLTGLCAGELP
jgi:hypothetical protein